MIRTTTVGEVMTTATITVPPEARLHDAVQILLRERISGLPVVDSEGRLLGILTEQDCLRVSYRIHYFESQEGTVAEAMTPDPTWIEPEADIMTAVEVFLHRQFRRLPVLSNGRLVGLITRRDALREVYPMAQ
jgi:CBS domain-containing protein